MKTLSSATTRGALISGVPSKDEDYRAGGGGKGGERGDGGCNNGSLVLADREIVICTCVAMCV